METPLSRIFKYNACQSIFHSDLENSVHLNEHHFLPYKLYLTKCKWKSSQSTEILYWADIFKVFLPEDSQKLPSLKYWNICIEQIVHICMKKKVQKSETMQGSVNTFRIFLCKVIEIYTQYYSTNAVKITFSYTQNILLLHIYKICEMCTL